MTRIQRNHIITAVSLVCLVLFSPRLCAQSAQMSAEEALETRQKFVDYGKKYIGCPYVSGATGPNAFDCSGFVYAVSRESIGWQLPRQVKNIYSYTKIIDDSKREAGDLVFFKTTSSGEVSHIGIYIGNGQFLHCASDGPNTGVILSSLNEAYWKGKYFCTGRFLPASDSASLMDSKETEEEQVSSASAKSSGTNSRSVSSGKNSGFIDSIMLDGIFSLDWSFFTPEYFRLNFRGLRASAHATYEGKYLKPGIGTMLKWDRGTGTFQIPIILSLTMNEYFRIFAGPVITAGTPHTPGDSDRKIEASFFPGLIGIGWNSPSVQVGKTRISFSQEIQYTIFNDTDGAALSPVKSLGSGLVLSSGIRVTLPLKELIK